MSDFTDGPWKAVRDSGLQVLAPCGRALAELWLRGESVKECADARLISAAPDFYKAADDLLQLFHGDDDVCPEFSKFIDALRPEDRKAVYTALQGLQEAIDKADGN
jgi:hypothetical protein